MIELEHITKTYKVAKKTQDWEMHLRVILKETIKSKSAKRYIV